MKLSHFLSSFLLALTVTAITLPCDADAARLGGGRSFGSQPAMRAPAARPEMQRSPFQSGTTMNSRSTAGSTGSRGGLFSGFGGGLLGGFLAGSIFSSLLGGSSTAAGTAAAGSGGIGLLDILLMGLAVLLILRFINRRGAAREKSQSEREQSTLFPTPRPSEQPAPTPQGMQRTNLGESSGASAWDALRGTESQAGNASVTASAAADVPAGFDQEEFLRGAKMAYTHLQAAWDSRDLQSISQFATASVIEELRNQMAADPTPSKTQILLVNAQLLSMTEFGAQDKADVYFDVLMRESATQEQPTNAREIWHFVREHEKGNWMLDGIQQTE